MPEQQCDIRYAEKSCAGDISSENIFWFWGDKLEIFQTLTIGDFDHKVSVAFDKISAIRYAKMILDRYDEKYKGEPELKNYFHEIEKVAKAAGDAARDGYLWGRG